MHADSKCMLLPMGPWTHDPTFAVHRHMPLIAKTLLQPVTAWHAATRIVLDDVQLVSSRAESDKDAVMQGYSKACRGLLLRAVKVR